MKYLFDPNTSSTDNQAIFSVDGPVEISFWGGALGDAIKVYALLIDASDPQFQLYGCDVKNYQYVPTPIADMEYKPCTAANPTGKLAVLNSDNRLLYIERPGWYKAVYTGSGLGDSIVAMQPMKQPCACC